ncbi:MAG: glycosyltransferase, partial [Candidatus Hodarchaeota archaeon]
MKDISDIKDSQQFELKTSIFNINKDDITVVIPVLNEEEGIGTVIEWVKKEDYRNILVIDGYSTDNTVLVATKNGVGV